MIIWLQKSALIKPKMSLVKLLGNRGFRMRLPGVISLIHIMDRGSRSSAANTAVCKPLLTYVRFVYLSGYVFTSHSSALARSSLKIFELQENIREHCRKTHISSLRIAIMSIPSRDFFQVSSAVILNKVTAVVNCAKPTVLICFIDVQYPDSESPLEKLVEKL